MGDGEVTNQKAGFASETEANTGSAAGNHYWLDLGDFKFLWGVGSSQTYSATSRTIILPAGLFTSVQSINWFVMNSTNGNTTVRGTGYTSGTRTASGWVDSVSATIQLGWLVIGN